jgi:hypothetical protein
MIKQLIARPDQHDKDTPRKLQFLSAIVEGKPSTVRLN